MAPSLSVTSLVTLALVAVDGARLTSRRPASNQDSGLVLAEQAGLMNSSILTNTGCQGRVEHHYNIGSTNDGCGGQYESEMNNPETGGQHRRQPAHGGWFMVSTTNRRRHRWYCGGTSESQDCGGGNCMQVWHHSRRRFPANCGQCTCHQPRATHAAVCLTLKYGFQGGSSGYHNETVTFSVGTYKRVYTTSDTVHSASVGASASMDGVIPQISATFGLTASTEVTVVSSFHSAFDESRTTEYTSSKTLFLNMSNPVYILHAQNYIYFEDGSYARLGAKAVLQFTAPQAAGCFEIPLELSVLSVDHSGGDDDKGRYFNFDVAGASALLGTPLGNSRVYSISQYRNGNLIRTGNAKFWTQANGGSIGNGHGRFDPIENSAPGQWQAGDTIQFQ